MPRMTFLLPLCLALALPGAAGAQSATVLGNDNQLLADGSASLAAGRYEEGIRLTLAGLEVPNNPSDEAAAHSNLCAGYAALKRWSKALPHCNRSLEIDRHNWRTYNNRAAVFVGLKLYDLAVTDVNAGLLLDPDSQTLHKSLEVVHEHKEAALRDRRKQPTTT
jgi:tetratricopeptide (TPR) repeat protein